MLEIFLLNQAGQRLRLIEHFVSCSVSMAVNDYGAGTLVVDGVNFSAADFQRNYRLEFERNGRLLGGAPYRIKKVKPSLSKEGEYLIAVSCLHANSLLKERLIAYYAGSVKAGATNERCDTLIERLVSQNIGSQAQNGPHVLGAGDNLRDYPAPDISSYFSVISGANAAPVTSRDFARRSLLETLKDVANDSYQNGTSLFFGIEKNTTTGKLEFKTRLNQWGTNRAGSTVVSPDFANLTDVSREWDWENEATVAYALGGGETNNRVVRVRHPAASDLNWVEATVDARNNSTVASLDAEADSLLTERMVRELFSGKIQDTAGFRFQEDWDWGDRITASFQGSTVAWVNKVSIQYANGEETINAVIEAVQ